jgi:serine/threonine protein kinase
MPSRDGAPSAEPAGSPRDLTGNRRESGVARPAGLQSRAVLPSLRMGKYVVEGQFGPGGVTETYLARLPAESASQAEAHAAGQLFALKMLRPDRVPEGDYAKVARRFVAAGRQLRDFHRPGFCRVVDVSDDPAATFIVSEHIAGCDLARLLEISRAEVPERPGVDPVVAALLGSEIARLLHVGHSAKPVFCHLGLSPQNVTVTETGEVVLLDAGIAAVLRSITEQPAERWWFVAPELCGVDTAAMALDDRHASAADLYSLGALLYFLVTGQPPAPTPPGRAGQLRQAPPELVGVSANLSAAVRRLLSPEPEDRPESAAVLVDWLAGGIDSVRERQRRIAEGLRVAENGARLASVSREIPVAAGALSPLLFKLPEVPGANAESKGLGAGLDRNALRWGFLSIAVLLAMASAAAALWWWQGSRPSAGPRGDVPREQASVDVQPSASSPEESRGAGGGANEQAYAVKASLGEQVMARVAGHLIVETVPPGATVWVDGVARGTTFADIMVGGGVHRVVVLAPGHRAFRDAVDTTRGAIIRRNLVPVVPATKSSGFVTVECQTTGKFPVLLDDEETGLLCPAMRMPATLGKHTVGIFLPGERRTVAVETTVEPGARAAIVRFTE